MHKSCSLAATCAFVITVVSDNPPQVMGGNAIPDWPMGRTKTDKRGIEAANRATTTLVMFGGGGI